MAPCNGHPSANCRPTTPHQDDQLSREVEGAAALLSSPAPCTHMTPSRPHRCLQHRSISNGHPVQNHWPPLSPASHTKSSSNRAPPAGMKPCGEGLAEDASRWSQNSGLGMSHGTGCARTRHRTTAEQNPTWEVREVRLRFRRRPWVGCWLTFSALSICATQYFHLY